MAKITGGHIKVNPFHLDDAAGVFTKQVTPATQAIVTAADGQLNVSIGPPFDAAFGAAINRLLANANAVDWAGQEMASALHEASQAYQGVDTQTATGGGAGHRRNFQ